MALTNLSQITTSGISTLADINLNNITGVAATFTGNVTVGGTLTYDDVTNIDSVGLVTARSGVNITGGDLTLPDSIIHAGDTNTKIRFPAADTFTVETNGVERLRVNNAGKIGLGDDDPNVPVNIKSAPITFAGIDIHLKLEDTTSMAADVGGVLAFEGLYTSGGAEAVYAAVHGGKENASSGDYAGYFRVLTRPNGGLPTERLRITSAGDIGIGVTNPTSFGPTLQVAGTDPALLLQDTATAVDYFGMNIASGAVNTWYDDASSFVIHTASALSGAGLVERLRITSAGSVGIGNNNPLYKLSVLTSGTTDTSLHLATSGGASDNGDATNSIRFTGGTNTRWANAKYEAFAHIFHGNGAERLRIDSGGRVLQGLTSAKFGFFNDNNAPPVHQIQGDTYYDTAFSIFRDGSGGSGPNFILAKGRGAIVQDNDILGTISFQGHDGTTELIEGASIVTEVDGTPTSNQVPSALVFKTNSGSSTTTERLRITSAGNIGVGQTNPQGDLHIGNISGSKNIIMHSANNGNARIRFREGGSNASGFNEYSIGMFGAGNAMTIEGQGAGEIIRIMGDNGRIGIATDNPGAILDVEGTLLVGTSGLANGNATINGHLIVDRTGVSGANPWLSVYSGGSTVFYVNGGGSVFADGGVNATSFTAGTSGTGNGNSSIFGSLTVDRNGIASSNTWFQVKNGTTPIIYANGQGKVGINLSSPQTTFHSSGTTNGQQATFGISSSGLKISTFQKTDNDAGVILDAQQSSNGTLTFATTGTERLRIDGYGSISFNSGTVPVTHYSAKYIYISDSGNDTTGNGTSSAPWRTMSKALGQVPKFLVYNCQIIIMGSSFTDGGGHNTLKGICGPGKVYISSQSGVVTYNKTKQFVVYDCQAWIEFQNIAFVCPVGGTGFALERNHYIDFKSGCTYEFQGQGGWSWQAGVYALHNERIIVSCNTTCTNNSTSGLGGVWYFDNCKSVSFDGDLTKNGTQFGNHGISCVNGSWIYLSGDITNFVRGLSLGANHYGNETRADAVIAGTTISSCGTGVKLYNGSLLRNYSSSFSNNSATNIDASGGVLY